VGRGSRVAAEVYRPNGTAKQEIIGGPDAVKDRSGSLAPPSLGISPTKCGRAFGTVGGPILTEQIHLNPKALNLRRLESTWLLQLRRDHLLEFHDVGREFTDTFR
jgi:hypothetical protein